MINVRQLISNGKLSKLKTYFNNKKDLINKKDDLTPIYYAVTKNKQTVELLVSLGAKVNVTDWTGDLPLQILLNNSPTYEKVKFLLCNGAKLHQKYYKGDTEMHLATYQNLPITIAKLLLDRGALINILSGKLPKDFQPNSELEYLMDAYSSFSDDLLDLYTSQIETDFQILDFQLHKDIFNLRIGKDKRYNFLKHYPKTIVEIFIKWVYSGKIIHSYQNEREKENINFKKENQEEINSLVDILTALRVSPNFEKAETIYEISERNKLKQDFAALYRSDLTIDNKNLSLNNNNYIIIKLNKIKIKINKFVLLSRSRSIREFFQKKHENQKDEEKSNLFVIQDFSNVNLQNFKIFIQFLYTDEIDLEYLQHPSIRNDLSKLYDLYQLNQNSLLKYSLIEYNQD
ncbi:ankyrin repeat-containing protein [Anaeramoeba flamelloides]|uniref:Ankyrin repeat-containing protein n=1 Tax=Anaeramoeba flamelloides TaxID=1746091 RepID=A0ABQ8XU22_9EUKA|nr:ankyrin repeat-containing protein [Anaeramoeba flamelloides]